MILKTAFAIIATWCAVLSGVILTCLTLVLIVVKISIIISKFKQTTNEKASKCNGSSRLDFLIKIHPRIDLSFKLTVAMNIALGFFLITMYGFMSFNYPKEIVSIWAIVSATILVVIALWLLFVAIKDKKETEKEIQNVNPVLVSVLVD